MVSPPRKTKIFRPQRGFPEEGYPPTGRGGGGSIYAVCQSTLEDTSHTFQLYIFDFLNPSPKLGQLIFLTNLADLFILKLGNLPQLGKQIEKNSGNNEKVQYCVFFGQHLDIDIGSYNLPYIGFHAGFQYSTTDFPDIWVFRFHLQAEAFFSYFLEIGFVFGLF